MKTSKIFRLLLILVLMVSYLGCSPEDILGHIIDNIENSPQNPVYLSYNGITVRAREWAEVGDTGEINGITYTVVDEAMLRDMVENKDDLTKLATSKVSNMYELFKDYPTFNQDIGNWDVRGVTNMDGMFQGAASFNQDIGYWDVFTVVHMTSMFSDAVEFNQDLSSWTVYYVSYCQDFDYNTPKWILPKPNFTNCTP